MRRAPAILTLCALALPAAGLAQEEPPEWNWGDEAPPPAPPPAGDDQAAVDVSVGIGTPGAGVTFSTFHDGLGAYGDWVSVPSYGQVWRPSGVPAGWRPYYYGRWEWTSEGWLWVSDEPFGWATYHYGRWAYDPSYGWVWVPGYQWAPAWVTWRYSPDYVGWAPLAPGFSVYVSAFPVVHSWWTFVPCGSFAGVPVYRHAYAPAHVPRIWAATRPAPPRAVAFGHTAPAWGGPARGFLETRTGRPIPTVRPQPVSSPGAARLPARAGVVPIYRPEARPAAGWGRAPAAAARPAPGPESRLWAPRPGSPEPRPSPAWGAPRPAPAPRQAPPPRAQAPSPGRAPPSAPAPRYGPAPAPAPRQAPPAAPYRGPPGGGGHGAPAPGGGRGGGPVGPQGGHGHEGRR
jgi:hypothetical protein